MLGEGLTLKKIFRYGLIVAYILNCNSNTKLAAQNILPDGSFEETNVFEYEYPFSAFEHLVHWKPSSFQFFDSTLVTSPDLFVEGEIIPASSPTNFWNVSYGASLGKNYVGLTNIATQDGAFLPETITTELNEQLEPGSYYALSLDYRNKGRDNIHPSPMMCIEEDLKKLIFYFDDHPVSVSLNQLENTSTPSSDQYVEIHAASMKPYQVSAWEKIGTCFEAIGNEKYMALSMSTGRVQVYPPCVILDDYFDIFLHYYFDVDNIRLEKIPDTLNIKTTFCKGRPNIVNMKDSLLLPPMLSTVYFSFNGTNTNGIINIDSGGQHWAYAHLDCVTIPILIDAIEVDCVPMHYAPNIFSTTENGINDTWKIFLKTNVPITDFNLTIFDRWGSIVFESLDEAEGWSGNNSDTMAEAGTYTWLLRYVYLDPEFGRISQVDSGELLLIR